MGNIWKAYQYLFYKYYKWDGCQSALLLVSFLMGCNFLTLLCFIQLFTGYDFSQPWSSSKLDTAGVGIIFLIINHFLFLRNERYKLIEKKFNKENSKAKKRGNYFAFGFIIATFAMGVLAGSLVHLFRPSHQVENENLINPITQVPAIKNKENKWLEELGLSIDYNDKMHAP